MTRIDDAMVLPLVERIHTCVCETLEARGLAADCKCILAPGAAFPPSFPAAGKGVAWVGIETIAPMEDTFCSGALVVGLNVGVLRCMPVTRDDPSAAQYAEYMAQALADMQALRKALLCCDHEVEDVALGTWTPYGPEGGVYGGFWTATVG